MDSYEKMEQDMHEFKKYLKMTMDLLCDAYKWKTLAEYADDITSREKYQTIGDTLYDMFMQEHNSIGEKFKKEN